jgi:protein SCO1/2
MMRFRVLALFAVSALHGIASAPSAATGAPLPRDSVYQLDATLTDQAGRTTPWRARRGRPQLVAMFYTSCQYICPLIVDSGKAVEKQLSQAQRLRLGILLVSMDPARDDPDALRAVADQRGLDLARWTLASPPGNQVRAIAGVLGIRYRALADGEFNHTSAMILLDADGRILASTDKMGTQPDPDFVAAVRRATSTP